MYVYHVISIDTDALRASVRRHREQKGGWTAGQAKALIQLYDLFEEGRFNDAVKLTARWRDGKDGYNLRDAIDEKVWTVLLEVKLGEHYATRRDL